MYYNDPMSQQREMTMHLAARAAAEAAAQQTRAAFLLLATDHSTMVVRLACEEVPAP